MSVKAIILLDEGSKTKGKVENLIEITAQAALGFRLPQGRLLWDCGQYPVAIGDDWNDGVFSREGGALEPVLTAEQQIAELEDKLAAANAKNAALAESQQFLEDCIAEMAEVVYA